MILAPALHVAAILLSRTDPADPVSSEHVAVPQAAEPRPEDFGLVIARDLRDVVRPKGSRGRAVGVRDWDRIVGITWHQTGTRDFAADHPGLEQVPAHLMLHRDGLCSLLHHVRAYVQHGNALNAGTYGVEIAARAAGTEGNPSTFWRSARERLGYHAATKTHELAIGHTPGHPGRWHPPKTVRELVAEATDAQLAQIPRIARYVAAVVEHEGGRIAGHWAHRQGTNDRGSDPGSRIYKVVDRTRAELGLRDVSQLTLGKGQPVPAAWRA